MRLRSVSVAANLGILFACLLLGFSTGLSGSSDSQRIESRSGRYRAEISIEATAERYPELNRWRATVLDSAGSVLYRIERDVPYDIPFPALALSDEGGASVLLNAFDGIVEFIDGRGIVVRRWRPFAGEEPSYERILKCSVSGDRIAFLFSEPGAEAAHIAAMDLLGMPSWDAALAFRDAGEIYLAGDGETVVAGGSTFSERAELLTTILEWGGGALDTLEMLFRAADIDTASGRIALADAWAIVEGLPGQLRPIWTVKTPEDVVREVRYVRGRLLILTERVGFTSSSPRYGPSRITLLNRDGRVELEQMLKATSDQPATLKLTDLAATVSLGVTELTVPLPR